MKKRLLIPSLVLLACFIIFGGVVKNLIFCPNESIIEPSSNNSKGYSLTQSEKIPQFHSGKLSNVMTSLPIPLPPLHARLAGVLLGKTTSEHNAFVYDDENGHELITLEIGDSFQGRIVDSIIHDHVSLLRPDGNRESLFLASDPQNRQVIESLRKNEFQIHRKELAKAVNHNPQTLLSQASVIPHIEQYQLKGFKLTKISQGSLFEQAGFKNGDIIDEVNGIPLRRVNDLFTFYHAAKQSQEIEVVVRRYGDRQTLRYVFE